MLSFLLQLSLRHIFPVVCITEQNSCVKLWCSINLPGTVEKTMLHCIEAISWVADLGYIFHTKGPILQGAEHFLRDTECSQLLMKSVGIEYVQHLTRKRSDLAGMGPKSEMM